MKKKLRRSIMVLALFLIPSIILGQAPDLGTTVNFVLFSTDGAVSNTGISQLTGKVGTNNGSNTGFGNVNGGMHAADTVTAQCATDLLVAYNELNSATPNFFPAASLGGGQILNAGVYAISGAATLDLDLTLDAEGDTSAIFIFQISGPLSTNANSKVKLINGAQACNVFWKIEGLLDLATGTTMRGTIIVNNAGINMNTGDTLEGRALTTTGAISIDGLSAYTPIGCGSPTLSGPTAPAFNVVGCFGIFSANGPVTNSGVSNVVGDVGTNVGLTTGYDPLLVAGAIHPIPDGVTAQATADLLVAYNYVSSLPQDIELLYPSQFGGNLVLTPHTYVLNGSTTFTDTLYLNAMGNASAIFVIKIFGALSTSTYSKVILINGTLAENVYWMVNGAIDINDYSIFNGTIISQGAINLFTGVSLNGRALTTVGAIETNAINGVADMIPVSCESVGIMAPNASDKTITIYPNPFSNSTTIELNDASQIHKSELRIYNVLGVEVMSETITGQTTTINTSNLPSGIYFFELIKSDNTILSGTMISQQQK